jgi:hypothetical protein
MEEPSGIHSRSRGSFFFHPPCIIFRPVLFRASGHISRVKARAIRVEVEASPLGLPILCEDTPGITGRRSPWRSSASPPARQSRAPPRHKHPDEHWMDLDRRFCRLKPDSNPVSGLRDGARHQDYLRASIFPDFSRFRRAHSDYAAGTPDRATIRRSDDVPGPGSNATRRRHIVPPGVTAECQT